MYEYEYDVIPVLYIYNEFEDEYCTAGADAANFV
jgi:hypothetical protein